MFISLIENLLKYIPEGLIDNNSALFKVMLGANKRQAIIWHDVDQDPWCHMVSLGHNELIYLYINKLSSINSLRPGDAYLGHHLFCFWKWLVTCLAPSHTYINFLYS